MEAPKNFETTESDENIDGVARSVEQLQTAELESIEADETIERATALRTLLNSYGATVEGTSEPVNNNYRFIVKELSLRLAMEENGFDSRAVTQEEFEDELRGRQQIAHIAKAFNQSIPHFVLDESESINKAA